MIKTHRCMFNSNLLQSDSLFKISNNEVHVVDHNRILANFWKSFIGPNCFASGQCEPLVLRKSDDFKTGSIFRMRVSHFFGDEATPVCTRCLLVQIISHLKHQSGLAYTWSAGQSQMSPHDTSASQNVHSERNIFSPKKVQSNLKTISYA